MIPEFLKNVPRTFLRFNHRRKLDSTLKVESNYRVEVESNYRVLMPSSASYT